MKKLAPIVIFVYARPEHTKKMIEALAQNKLANESEVWIFSDNAKKEEKKEKVKQVREYIHSIKDKNFFKNVSIIESGENKGLANSVISGVTQIINKEEKVIVLEDDLIVTNNFLEYMNEALDFYNEDQRIWSISGYNIPIKIPANYKEDIYLSYRGCSWGWATWKDRWNKVDWEVSDYSEFKKNLKTRRRLNRGGLDMSDMLDKQMRGRIDSWAIRWCYEQSKRDMYTIYPTKSLVYNEGLDGTGTHSGITNLFAVDCSNITPKLQKNLLIDKRIIRNFKKIYNKGMKNKIARILTKLKLERLIDIIRGIRNK